MNKFDEKYRPALNFCGSHSGRDCDKAAETGLTPFVIASGSVAFEEACLVFDCKKLFAQDMDSAGFVGNSIDWKNEVPCFQPLEKSL